MKSSRTSSSSWLAALLMGLAGTPMAQEVSRVAERLREGAPRRGSRRCRNSGTGAYRAQRSPELVTELKAAAEAKRTRKAIKLRSDSFSRDFGYYASTVGNPTDWSPRHCFRYRART